jgi:hypothetical protein
MVREEKCVRSKSLHKLLIVVIKYIPMTISMFYILNTILCWLGIDAPVLSNIAGVSLFTWLFIYLSSVVFQFCIYHKMFLYYILIEDLLNIYDFYFGIPISNVKILEIHSVLIGILLFSILFVYLNNYVTKDNKGDIIKYNK